MGRTKELRNYTRKQLMERLNVNLETAKKIQHIARDEFDYNHRTVDACLDELNSLIGGCGVEPLSKCDYWDAYYCDIRYLYINKGDTYDTTIIFDTDKQILFIGDWGSIVELSPDSFV